MPWLRLGNLPFFGEVALIAVLAWMVSGWMLPTNSPTLSSLNPNKITAQATTLPNLTKLVRVPLFGKIRVPVQPVGAVTQAEKPVTASRLHIKLLGTVVSEDHAAAIIALAPGREQRAFFIGDSIQPGVTLKSVEAEAIIVERNGKLERVSLEKGAKLTSAPMPANSAIINSAHTPPPSATYRKINRRHLQHQLQNFSSLLSQARVIPHIANGKPAGFIISEIVPGSLYQQAGLRNGDIIMSVNGKRITDAKQAMVMYQTLKNAAALDIKLIRAGQIRQVHYDIR